MILNKWALPKFFLGWCITPCVIFLAECPWCGSTHVYWKQKTFEGENIHEFQGFRATRESFLLKICHTHIMLSFSIPWKLSPPNGHSYQSAKVFSLENSTTNPILHYWNSICTGTTNPQYIPSSTWLCSTVHNCVLSCAV